MSLISLEDQVRYELGLSKSPLDWTYEQRLEYNKRLAALIKSTPGEYKPGTLKEAEDVSRSTYEPLSGAGIGESVGIFFGELANQAEKINPLSQQNRGALASRITWIVAGAVLLFAAIYAFRTPTLKAKSK